MLNFNYLDSFMNLFFLELATYINWYKQLLILVVPLEVGNTNLGWILTFVLIVWILKMLDERGCKVEKGKIFLYILYDFNRLI